MPRTKMQNESIKEQRKRDILNAAIPLFAVHGFSETKISSIAEHAGLSHGSVYLYYRTKEELWRDAVVVPVEEAMDAFVRILSAEELGPVERIQSMVNYQIRTLPQQQSVMRLVHMVLAQKERFPELVAEIYRITDRYFQALQPLIRQAQSLGALRPGNPWVITWSYFCYLNGVVIATELPPESPLWDGMIEMGLRIFGQTTV